MTDAISAEQKLPPLRDGVRVEMACILGTDKRMFTAQYNFYPDGRLAEMFCRPFQTGAYLEHLLDRFCIAVSFGLRHGARIADMAKTMGDDLPIVPDVMGEQVPDNIFSAVMRTAVDEETKRIASLTPPNDPVQSQVTA